MADANLTPQEIAFKNKYGRLPPKKKKGPIHHRLQGGGRQFFDSADYAMNSSKKATANVEAATGIVATADNIVKKELPRPTSMHKDSKIDILDSVVTDGADPDAAKEPIAAQ